MFFAKTGSALAAISDGLSGPIVELDRGVVGLWKTIGEDWSVFADSRALSLKQEVPWQPSWMVGSTQLSNLTKVL